MCSSACDCVGPRVPAAPGRLPSKPGTTRGSVLGSGARDGAEVGRPADWALRMSPKAPDYRSNAPTGVHAGASLQMRILYAFNTRTGKTSSDQPPVGRFVRYRYAKPQAARGAPMGHSQEASPSDHVSAQLSQYGNPSQQNSVIRVNKHKRLSKHAYSCLGRHHGTTWHLPTIHASGRQHVPWGRAGIKDQSPWLRHRAAQPLPSWLLGTSSAAPVVTSLMTVSGSAWEAADATA